jgi:hypothetical protein
MSRLKDISAALVFRARLSTSQTSITPAQDTPWLLRGGRDALRSELEKLYWEGIKAELENIIRTLKAWQEPDVANVTLPEDKDDFVHGFDTFIDHVSQEAREYAIRQGMF